MPPQWRRTAGTVTLALVSLLLAVALWVAVTDAENPSTIEDFPGPIPVRAVNVTQGLAVRSIDQDVVFVRISVPEDQFSELTTANFVAEVNMATEQEGTSNRNVTVRAVGVDDVEIVDVSPSSVTVVLEQETAKEVPVRANRQGTTPQGVRISEIETSPTEVTVSGAASLVDRVESATLDINLTGLRVNQQQEYALSARDASGVELRPLRIEPRTADVRVSVTQVDVSRPVTVALRTRGDVAEGYNLVDWSVEPPLITVEGPVQLVQSLTSIRTEQVDIGGLRTTETQTVRLQLPVNVSAQRETVSVTLVVEPAIGDWTFAVVPRLENVPLGLQTALQTQTITVVVRGEIPVLRALAPGEVRATFDLSDLEEGVHVLQPEISLPDDIELVSVQPEEAVVVLRP